MTKQYVIKGYQWGYNDETYYPEGGFIQNLYTDRETAEAALTKLERQHWSGIDLNETHVLFDSEPDTLATLNSFLVEKLGKGLDEAGHETYVPSRLSNDDFIAFLDLADIRAYKLIEFDGEPEFWAIWLADDEVYLTTGEDDALIFGGSIDELKKELKDDPWTLTYLSEEHESLEGDLEAISVSPRLLRNLIASHEGATYEDGRIGLDEEDIDLHVAINELLHTPMFEFRKLTLDEIRRCE